MAEIRTDAIRAFQKRVNEMNNANQRDIRLSAQEARNVSAELSQLTAILLDLQSVSSSDSDVEVTVLGSKF